MHNKITIYDLPTPVVKKRFNWQRIARSFAKSSMTFAVASLGSVMTVFIIILVLWKYTEFDLAQNIHYKLNEVQVQKDQVVNIVAELCGREETNISKADCVIDFYEAHYNYTIHYDTFRPATEFINKGGVCRDFAINVCATMNLMNITCSYVHVPHHVFPKFYVDDGYCIYDGMWWCQKVDLFEVYK